MTVKHVEKKELLAQVGRCMFGERLVVEREGKRFSARVQHVGVTGVKVVPETMLVEHEGEPGDINGITVSYDDIREVDIDGTIFRLA
ncbi:hypothetical protein HOP62_06310 [Halomonas sp. MCCC 1A17488]|uniref:Uncharacterized protein n=1 Tax=Billgrantia sulfidoxydans TaxID=2733484 RepID=A0ABX7W3V5_9GAMM|nr:MULTISPECIES: hypothetical protein [Halomonas]MCE8015692.1 hypothetical protein [Halomonas sp. MCCC 1A17488]MCG3239025.1 hypothetical protein [Halomonas sp. MCCC 1A17488]QPP51024.1 hypothetical protein I4484_08085 [Halomonas sp. SS10-MC5]QTP54536.1 hypothetical protein HNO51_07495 [Halomonas sulfidoxydans]